MKYCLGKSEENSTRKLIPVYKEPDKKAQAAVTIWKHNKMKNVGKQHHRYWQFAIHCFKLFFESFLLVQFSLTQFYSQFTPFRRNTQIGKFLHLYCMQ